MANITIIRHKSGTLALTLYLISIIYTNAISFALFGATTAVKDFLYARSDLEIWVMAIGHTPYFLIHTAGHTF